MLSCVHSLIIIKFLQVIYYVLHILDIVRQDNFHPWKTSVAYAMFWGGSTISDIRSALVLGVYAL